MTNPDNKIAVTFRGNQLSKLRRIAGWRRQSVASVVRWLIQTPKDLDTLYQEEKARAHGENYAAGTKKFQDMRGM